MPTSCAVLDCGEWLAIPSPEALGLLVAVLVALACVARMVAGALTRRRLVRGLLEKEKAGTIGQSEAMLLMNYRLQGLAGPPASMK